jgi:hypothetical protein
MRIGKGAVVGLLGGLLGLIGVFLPWVTVSASLLGVTVLSLSLPGTCIAGIGSIQVPVVGSVPCAPPAEFATEGAIYFYGILLLSLLGLIVSLLGRKMTSMLALVFGVLVLLLGVVATVRVVSFFGGFGGVPGLTISIGYGLILCIIGGVILLVGGFLGWTEAKKAGMTTMPPDMSAPPPMA